MRLMISQENRMLFYQMNFPKQALNISNLLFKVLQLTDILETHY